MTVHPRAGGERGRGRYRVDRAIGSSPRGRGTPRGSTGVPRRRRFIPARAGNARHALVWRVGEAVHPRAGGERADHAGAPPLITGSSPRGRGTRYGWIPKAVPDTVHPRAGGERGPAGLALGRGDGSSPRGRGTRRGPASVRTKPPVHPRAGGERGPTSWAPSASSGSSPRGRGTLAVGHVNAFDGRFIPARAGNAALGAPGGSMGSVHPRAGGERTGAPSPSATHCGSSPRGRGTQRSPGSDPAAPRFIPARAGNAYRESCSRRRSTVHPRAGGERKVRAARAVAQAGSSPRGRGTPQPRRKVGARHRFIPARAGNAAPP